MKILLIKPGEQFPEKKVTPYFTPAVYPPLGLLYLGGSIENAGHEAEIIDLWHEENPDERIKKSVESSDAVGISVYTTEIHLVKKITEKIREIDENIPIILGGPRCTYYLELALEETPLADICVIGEGEYVILDIIKYLEGKKNLSEINGIYYREKNKIKKGKPLKVIHDLDSIPFPARNLVERYDYGKANGLDMYKARFTSLQSSRGCPNKCKFCSRYGNLIKDWKFRQRSAESIIEEMKIIDKKYRTVFIADDCFLSDVKRSHKIMDGLIKAGTKVELIIEGARVDSASKALYKKMKKANVKFIGYGIESGNQDVLDFYNKKITIKQIKNAVKLGRKMGFITMATFILGAPIETREHIERTIKFACSLPLDLAFFSPLWYIHGSELWSEAVKNNIIKESEKAVHADISKGLSNFTSEELDDYVKYAYNKFYHRPSYLFKEFNLALIRKDLTLIRKGLNMLSKSKKIG